MLRLTRASSVLILEEVLALNCSEFREHAEVTKSGQRMLSPSAVEKTWPLWPFPVVVYVCRCRETGE